MSNSIRSENTKRGQGEMKRQLGLEETFIAVTLPPPVLPLPLKYIPLDAVGNNVVPSTLQPIPSFNVTAPPQAFPFPRYFPEQRGKMSYLEEASLANSFNGQNTPLFPLCLPVLPEEGVLGNPPMMSLHSSRRGRTRGHKKHHYGKCDKHRKRGKNKTHSLFSAKMSRGQLIKEGTKGQLGGNDKDNNEPDVNNNVSSERDRQKQVSGKKLEKHLEYLKEKVEGARRAVSETKLKIQKLMQEEEELQGAWETERWGFRDVTQFEIEFDALRKHLLEREAAVEETDDLSKEKENLLQRICEMGKKLKCQEKEELDHKCRGIEDDKGQEFCDQFEQAEIVKGKKVELVKMLEREKLVNNRSLLEMNQSIARSIQQLKEINSITINVLSRKIQEKAHKTAWDVYKQVAKEPAQ